MNKINNIFKKYKILQVFTKEYRDETKMYECLEENSDVFKLNDEGFDVDENVKTLIKNNYKSNFKIDIK